MREIAPGLWHWTARHEHIEMEVSSYYLLNERVLIDAMLPPQGLGWFVTATTTGMPGSCERRSVARCTA